MVKRWNVVTRNFVENSLCHFIIIRLLNIFIATQLVIKNECILFLLDILFEKTFKKIRDFVVVLLTFEKPF